MIKISAVSFKQKSNNKTQKQVLKSSLEMLKNMQFSKEDIKKVQKFGAVLPFQNGNQVYHFIKNNNTKIIFDKFENPHVHALWDFENNTIKLVTKPLLMTILVAL